MNEWTNKVDYTQSVVYRTECLAFIHYHLLVYMYYCHTYRCIFEIVYNTTRDDHSLIQKVLYSSISE